MLLPFVLLVFGGVTAGTSPAEPETIATEGAAAFRPRIVLDARVESRRPPEAGRLKELAAEVKAIWAPYLDVEIAWPGDAVTRGLDDRVALVITDGLPEHGSVNALGWIDFVGPGRPARVIHVSVTSARRLASEAPWAVRAALAPGEMRERFVARALARSVAHELGHYLLRSPAHAPRGLMRSHFTALEVLNHRLGQFRLAPAESAVLEGRLLQYARALPAAPAPLQ